MLAYNIKIIFEGVNVPEDHVSPLEIIYIAFNKKIPNCHYFEVVHDPEDIKLQMKELEFLNSPEGQEMLRTKKLKKLLYE